MADPEVLGKSELPAAARIVVIGGGVGGASVAYHLAELGERDVVLLERADLTSGSTFHSAGLVGILRADPTLTRMNRYSAELYAKLQLTEHPPGWIPSGGLKLASSPERLAEIRRQASWARTSGLDLDLISAEEAHRLFPLMDTGGVLGAAWLPADGYVDPSQLCLSLIHGARAGGVRVHTRTTVTALETTPTMHGQQRVSKVRTDRGEIACEIVVDCGGMFAAEIARMVGVRVPIIPIAHQYLVTEGFRERTEQPLPTLRDPDNLVYWRQEVDGLLMGGYERDPAPWSVSASRVDAVPADFNGRLLPPDWPRFESIAENSRIRVPITTEVGIRTLVNGPEAFTPDNEFCLGESEVGGFFVAAGFCAHGIAGAGGIGKVMAEWIVSGDPGLDVWHMDLRRFGAAYDSPSFALARAVESYSTYYDVAYPNRERTTGRPLRTSPAYGWHAEHGAEFGEKAGWERVNWYRSNESADLESLRPAGWAGRSWSSAIVAEHRATRERAALFDETSFAKISITGPDAADLLEWVCDNRVARAIGGVTYTQLLTASGGIEADVTVARLGFDEFLLVTGTAFGLHEMSWLRRQAQARAADVRITDVTGQYVCFGLFGPRARDILGPLTPVDLSNAGLPFMTSQWTTIGDVPVRIARLTFVGEFGWEIYASTEYGATLWNLLWAAGVPHGMLAAGYRAIDSLRLEKGYRVWAADLTGETTPDEAGLSFCVKPGKPGGFLGAEALLAARAAGGPTRRLACLTLTDPQAVAIGSEPVRVADGRVVGRITSAGYGYTVGASIAYAYLPIADAKPGTPIEVDLFGTWVSGVVADDVLYDPTNSRVRA
ncbi:MAG TPA: FAD-dependent oxidoreductase [Kineosporiaceae bacterium]|nr:FAD-dependent oxidoreductase [Kineosporiaceae bacterium]